jgi:hypothetical protein
VVEPEDRVKSGDWHIGPGIHTLSAKRFYIRRVVIHEPTPFLGFVTASVLKIRIEGAHIDYLFEMMIRAADEPLHPGVVRTTK